MHLEDFSPGQRCTSAARSITLEDLEAFIRLSGDDHPIHRPTVADRAAAQTGTDSGGEGEGQRRAIVHGALGPALFTGFVQQMGLSEQALAMLDLHWSFLAPMHVGDRVTCELTVTRIRRSSSGGRGVVHRSIELRNQDGTVLQTGTSSLLVSARTDDSLPEQWDFLSKAAVDAIGAALDQDPGFREMTEAYDGTIGVTVGEAQMHLRVYRGRVIEASRRSLLGADFVVHISELDWTRLMTAPDNQFMQMSMTGRFRSRGSGAEYLRMTRALIAVVDTARALFAADRTDAQEQSR